MTSFNFTESKQKAEEHVNNDCLNQNVGKVKQKLQISKKVVDISLTN